MTEKQKNFLTELHQLCKKYGITTILSCLDKIDFFVEDDELLTISAYRNETFSGIKTTTCHFKP